MGGDQKGGASVALGVVAMGWKIQLACHGVEKESEGRVDCIALWCNSVSRKHLHGYYCYQTIMDTIECSRDRRVC